MPAAEARARPVAIARLRRRLGAGSAGSVPLLIVRLPALERTAWREGLRKARWLEREASAAFGQAAARVLRSADIIAHDRGSDVFLAALTAPTRTRGDVAVSIDARSALARISAGMESATRLEIEAGWTMVDASDGNELGDAIRRGLQRGAQERERYAFFSAVGHELRTPLASICGYLETLLDDPSDAARAPLDPATRRRFLSIAHKESLRLSRLVEGMFEISLLDLHAAHHTRSRTALDVTLDAAADACASAAAARSMTIVRARPRPAIVDMDADRLVLVLINLIENAIKHGRCGGNIAVGVDLADARTACVTIDDDGPGVEAGARERIFTLGARGKTAAPGTGIGLALVRLLLERAGGRVDVGSSPLGGARFRVHLRRHADGDATMPGV